MDLDLYPETDLKKDLETNLEIDHKTNLEWHPKLDSELDLDAGQSALQIAKSEVSFATKLPQF
jgi:hypothetical protein